MSFLDTIARARTYLEEQGRVSLRALRREFSLDDETLEELVEELVEVQRVAVREGAVLVSTRAAGREPAPATAPAAGKPDARKVVTILFADLAGSTALQERLDPESARRFMERYYRAMRTAVETHGGTLVKFLGDGVMAAFGVPIVTEDDAIRAVRAAVAMQVSFRTLAGEQRDIGLRVAVNTGEVVVSADNSDVVGDPVNVAARLQQEARDGDVVLGEATRPLVATLVTLEPLGTVALKGRTEAVRAYRVASLDRPTGTATVTFVGREEEMARITAVYEEAVAKPAARLAVLLGSPGLGKSRLIEEVGRRLGAAATVITAQCDAAGGATFAPVAQALRDLVRAGGDRPEAELQAAIQTMIPRDDADRPRIASGIGALFAGSSASPEETFFVIRRFLAALAARKPVLLVIDDLHWAEPLLLDLVEHLVQWGSGVPLLVLVGARPELRSLRSSLVSPGGFVADVVTLSGLDAGAAMRLAANVIGAADLPSAIAAKVLATSEGNPLFVGELARMLVEEGALERQGDRWRVGANLEELEMPPTIHALLAARIERLRPEERSVLEHASVVGRHFSRSAVAALGGSDGAALDARLEALRRTELIEPDSGWFLGEPALRFHHVLIRDAAYRRLLKGTRAELHQRLAEWIEPRAGVAGEHDETIGWHLEQAHQLLRELGPLDPSGRNLGERAAQRLAAAGRRALAGDDVARAAGLLGRAIDRLDDGDPARADLALDWCEALLSAGDVGQAAGAIEELGRFIDYEGPGVGGRGSGQDEDTLKPQSRSDFEADPRPPTPGPGVSEASAPPKARLRAWHTCFRGQLTALTAPQQLQETVAAVAAAADELAKLGDDAGEAKGHSVHAQALARLGKVGASETALDKALAAARRAGDRRRANAVLAGAPLAALWGPSPVTRASGRCLDVVRVLRITQGAPAVEAVALSCQGVLEALRGRTDAARRMIASSRKMVEELGIAPRLYEADVFAGRIDLLEGDAAAAERTLRSAHDGLRELGLNIDAARAGALLARAQLAQGKVTAAERASHESERLAGDDLQAAIAWRGVRAEALARRGETAAAVELAQSAVEIAAATDALLDHADARLALAATLRAAGRASEADEEEHRAAQLWEAKGATLLAEKARRDGASPAAAAASAADAASAVEPDAGSAAMDRLQAATAADKARRRVPPNAALACLERFGAAIDARDLEALANQFSEDLEVVHHPTAATYGLRAFLKTWSSMFRAERMIDSREPLATLGDSLLLGRHRMALEGFAEAHLTSVGAVEIDELVLWEVDESGRCRHVELFAPDRLGNAVARLYEKASPATFASARLTSAIVIDDVLALRDDALLVREGHRLSLWLSGGGPLVRTAAWDVGEEAEALSRFAATAPVSPSPEPSNPFANAAFRFVERRTRAWAARDWEGVVADVAPTLRMDDRRRMVRLEIGRDDFVTQLRMLFDQPASLWHASLLATRGDRLSLHRARFTAEVAAGGGALVIEEHLSLVEIDPDGRAIANVSFDLADLDAAYAELDRRYDAGEGRSHPAADAVIRAFRRAVTKRDWQPVLDRCAPTFAEHDHKAIAVLGTTNGPEGWVRNFRALVDLAPDTIHRVHHFRAAARGFCSAGAWIGSHEGGRYEIAIIAVIELNPQGLMVRADVYDVEQAEAALARFAELGADQIDSPFSNLATAAVARGTAAVDVLATRGERRFANLATRLNDRFTRAWAQRDWNTITALTAELHLEDRRRLLQMEGPAATNLAYLEVLFQVPRSTWTITPIATRGERFALSRYLFEGDAAEGGGPLAIDYLGVDEVGEDGRFLNVVLFDAEDLDAALEELETVWQRDEALRHPIAALWQRFGEARRRHDWEAVAACYAPEFVGHDHRLVGWGTLHGPSELVRSLRAMTDLAPDARMRSPHARISARAALHVSMWIGTRDGGAFESPFVVVTEVDAGGSIARQDFYDWNHLDAALTRFEEVSSATRSPEQTKAAPASAIVDRWQLGGETDWEALRASCAPDMVFEDRQSFARLTGDREMMIASLRQRVANGGRAERSLLGAAGDRVAIMRMLWTGGPAEGRFEIEYLALAETDAAGRAIAILLFAPDDLRSAQREAWARWAAIDPASRQITAACGAVIDAANDHDLTRYRAVFADELVLEDHRYGVRIDGADAYVEQVAQLWQQAPDSRIDGGWHWPAVTAHGAVTVMRRTGALADELLWLFTVERGRIDRIEVFAPDQAEAAAARLAELSADAQPARLEVRIPPNAAVRTLRAAAGDLASFDAGALQALVNDDFLYDDRSKRSLVRGGVEEWLRAVRFLVAETDGRFAAELLATAGERLALHRTCWNAGSSQARAEIENLRVIEVDEAGRLGALILFDPEDRAAASAELFERYVAHGADGASPAMVGLWRAWNDHDLAALRALLPDHFYLDDRRRTGVGRLVGAEAYVRSLAALWERSSDLRIDLLYFERITERGRLYVARRWGTQAEGGALDEVSVFVSFDGNDGGAFGLEIFDLEDLEMARTRFAELSAECR